MSQVCLTDLRFQFEFSTISLEDLALKHKLNVDELRVKAEEGNWEKQIPSEKEAQDSPGLVADYYTKARRTASLNTTQHTVSLWNRVLNAEVQILGKVEDLLYDIDTGAHINDADTLIKLTKIVDSFKSSNSLFKEAAKVVAQQDKDSEIEIEDTEDTVWKVKVVKSTRSKEDDEQEDVEDLTL